MGIGQSDRLWEIQEITNMAKTRQTFEQWKLAVNQAIERKVGMSSDDLPDWGYADAYEDGLSPASAASSAIRSAKEY
jgi:Family of unknown function (DUF5419)